MRNAVLPIVHVRKLRFGKELAPDHRAHGMSLAQMPESTRLFLDVVHPSRTRQSCKLKEAAKGSHLCVLSVLQVMMPLMKLHYQWNSEPQET